jgi:hypothetical protein
LHGDGLRCSDRSCGVWGDGRGGGGGGGGMTGCCPPGERRPTARGHGRLAPGPRCCPRGLRRPRARGATRRPQARRGRRRRRRRRPGGGAAAHRGPHHHASFRLRARAPPLGRAIGPRPAPDTCRDHTLAPNHPVLARGRHRYRHRGRRRRRCSRARPPRRYRQRRARAASGAGRDCSIGRRRRGGWSSRCIDGDGRLRPADGGAYLLHVGHGRPGPLAEERSQCAAPLPPSRPGLGSQMSTGAITC